MKRWEYKISRCAQSTTTTVPECDQDLEMENWLNSFGDSGWELVTLSGTATEAVAWFKRAVDV